MKISNVWRNTDWYIGPTTAICRFIKSCDNPIKNSTIKFDTRHLYLVFPHVTLPLIRSHRLHSFYRSFAHGVGKRMTLYITALTTLLLVLSMHAVSIIISVKWSCYNKHRSSSLWAHFDKAPCYNTDYHNATPSKNTVIYITVFSFITDQI